MTRNYKVAELLAELEDGNAVYDERNDRFMTEGEYNALMTRLYAETVEDPDADEISFEDFCNDSSFFDVETLIGVMESMPAARYAIKLEHLSAWGADTDFDCLVSDREILDLAKEWRGNGESVADCVRRLLQQVETVTTAKQSAQLDYLTADPLP